MIARKIQTGFPCVLPKYFVERDNNGDPASVIFKANPSEIALANPLLKLFDDLVDIYVCRVTLVTHKSDSSRLEVQNDVQFLTFTDLTAVDMEGTCKHVGLVSRKSLNHCNKLYGKTVEL